MDFKPLKLICSIALMYSVPIFADNVASTSDSTHSASKYSNVIKTDTQRATTPQEDAKITKTLTNLIKNSKTLNDAHLNVSTQNGVVYLQGVVNSDTEATTAVELAESILGVADVDVNKLSVKSSQQPLADAYITAKVKGLLIREKLFGEKDVAAVETLVETKNGVVYLSGLLDNKQQIDNAIQIIKENIPDVKRVEYNIRTGGHQI